MRTKVPPDGEKALHDFGTRLGDELDQEFRARTPDRNPRKDLLLQAPDGSIWAVTVDDTGTLATTKVHG